MNGRHGTGRLRIAVAWLAVVALAACGSDQALGPTPPDGPEVKVAGPLSLDERDISATLTGERLVVAFVVHNEGTAAVKGAISVVVESLDGKGRYTMIAPFEARPGADTVTVALNGAPGQVEDADVQAVHVIRYRLDTALGSITGRRSLFVAMPRAEVVLLGPKTFYEGENTRLKVFARDAVTGQPFASQDITVRATVGEMTREVTVRTDEFGAAVADLRLDVSGSVLLEAQMTPAGGNPVACMQSAKVVRMLRVLVATDKPLYQPGQDMHIRVLALRKPHLHPEADKDYVIEVFDGKGNKVFKVKGKTNAYGIAFARFRLATEVNMGTYKVKAVVGETATEKAVTVDRYTLPKYKVEVAMGRAFYLVGEKVTGTLTARYFFGKPVAGGDVRLTFYTFDVEFTAFAVVSGKTDQEGLFPFEVQLPNYLVGQSLEQGKAIVRVVAEVTDTAGQVVEKETGLTVAQDAISVVLIPESGTIVPGVPNRFYVFVEDPSGKPLQAHAEVDAAGQSFALDTDAAGIGVFEYAPEAPSVTIQVSVRDAQGHEATRAFPFTAGTSGEAVLVRADKALYQVGETAAVTVFAPDAKDRIYLDVIRHGQIAREEAADLVDGRALIEVDLDQEMAGDVVFSAYYLGRTGQIVRDEKLVFVQGADALTVRVSPDKAPYKPGEEAKVAFQVSGQDGTPAVAALGVQVVDEAVYALSDAKPGLLRVYFELEEAIQQPKFEIHEAGFDLTSIVTATPEDEGQKKELERQAEVAFAALGNPGVVQAGSSWTEALRDANKALEPFYAQEKKRVLDSMRALIQSGDLTESDIPAYLEAQPRFWDFFGNAYVFGHTDNWTVTMQGLGMDEVAGTADDFKASFNTWEVWDRMWEEDGFFKGGGPPRPAAASDAGGVPEEPRSQGGEEPKVRKFFPETLYVNPVLITDESGQAVAQFTMADSITEWRVTTLANSADGRLGSAVAGMTVFLDFFVDLDVPRTLTRGDEVHFPVAVYNYLDQPQVVDLEVEAGDWAEILGSATTSVVLGPSEVKGVSVGLRATRVGWHGVTVKAKGSGGVSDAVMRLIEVTPDGIEVRGSDSGKLSGEVSRTVAFPMSAIPGTEAITVKVYPGVMAQAVEGLDSLLQMPSGCFEQTTATLWPNALVLDYITKQGTITPEIELKARQYVNAGYQRLLTFECTGGGFTWFGDPEPANLILSAMGVMEFTDIGKVHEIDETVVPRTIDFLASKQAANGSFHEDQGSEFATVRYDDLMTTCFVLWAFGEAGYKGAAADKAFGYVKAHVSEITTTYALALCAIALAGYAPYDSVTQGVLHDLVAKVHEEGDKAWWEAGTSQADCYYGGGDGTTIEATALAVLALLKAAQAPDLVGKAITFLASKKDSFGNWGTTHATILSLKAFVGSLDALVQEAAGTVRVTINGTGLPPLAISPDNADVFHQFELKDWVSPADVNHVAVSFEGEGTLMYQVVWSHFEPGSAGLNPDSPLRIEVAYDKTHLAVDDIVGVTATVQNVSGAPAPMVLVDLGIPPGFDLLTADLEKAVKDRLIEKFETTAKQILVYVANIDPGEVLTLTYQLRAKYPLKVQAPDSSASLYYDPDSKTSAPGEPIEVQ